MPFSPDALCYCAAKFGLADSLPRGWRAGSSGSVVAAGPAQQHRGQAQLPRQQHGRRRNRRVRVAPAEESAGRRVQVRRFSLETCQVFFCYVMSFESKERFAKSLLSLLRVLRPLCAMIDSVRFLLFSVMFCENKASRHVAAAAALRRRLPAVPAAAVHCGLAAPATAAAAATRAPAAAVSSPARPGRFQSLRARHDEPDAAALDVGTPDAAAPRAPRVTNERLITWFYLE